MYGSSGRAFGPGRQGSFRLPRLMMSSMKTKHENSSSSISLVARLLQRALQLTKVTSKEGSRAGRLLCVEMKTHISMCVWPAVSFVFRELHAGCIGGGAVFGWTFGLVQPEV